MQEAGELFHLQLGVTDQLPEEAGLQRSMVWHREGFSGGIEWMPEANVAAALADNFVTKTLKCPNSNLS